MADIRRYAELASTNDALAALALSDAVEGIWIVADQQTSGRGRRGRIWHSPPGNLFCSTLVRQNPVDPPLQQMSFVAALALHETLVAYTGNIHLKWPNDLLVEGKKLSGILLEAGGAKENAHVIIGIGVNLAHYPEDVERPATSIAALTGAAPQPMDVVTRLAENFARWRANWGAHGFAAVRAAWLARATGVGQRIEVRLGQETLFGMFTGLDEAGALLLRLDSGVIRAVHAGDVYGI